MSLAWLGGLLGWILIGGLIGWLSGLFSKGRSYGFIGDAVVGIVGSVVGGWLLNQILDVEHLPGLIGSMVSAVIGAVLLIMLLRMLSERERG